MGQYEFLFTAAAVYYLKHANVPHVSIRSHHFQQKSYICKAEPNDIVKLTPV